MSASRPLHHTAAKGLPGVDLDAERAVTSDRLNWLRAGVLGANDGIVSTAGLLLGVAGATPGFAPLLTAGVAGLAAGALSMGVGEYVSVSAQRDMERAAVRSERAGLRHAPQAELDELVTMLQGKGMSEATAREAAREMTAYDALKAHAELELGLSPGQYTNPWHAALASAIAFSSGALVPLLAILLASARLAVAVTVVAVVLALTATGLIATRLGGTPPLRGTVRNVAGGVLAMGISYAIGHMVGTQL